MKIRKKTTGRGLEYSGVRASPPRYTEEDHRTWDRAFREFEAKHGRRQQFKMGKRKKEK